MKATERQIAAALRKADGVVSHAAKKLKMERHSVYERIANSDYLKRVLKEMEEDMVETAEGVVAHHLKRKDKDIAKYVLDRKARKRGWGQKIDVGIDVATAEAIVAAIGGDPAKLRSLLSGLGVNSTEIP